MIIEKNGTKKLSCLKRGEVFEFNGDIFLKIREHHDINAVELATGNLYNISPEQEVIIFNEVKVVLK